MNLSFECYVCGEELDIEISEVYGIIRVKRCKDCCPTYEDIEEYCHKCEHHPENKPKKKKRRLLKIL